ncbi:thioredoxin-dependent thiol peroxidase [Candidatus Peribacteria bacterium]|nr:thioredoxin-dependent thiol peroxidase [Candidatus Peribacteria bacterium]
MLLMIGSPAPDFTLPDQDGNVHSLSNQQGKWVLVYFYPKDDTPGCTKEACGFRDLYDELKKLGVVIFGVSKDSAESHKKFAGKFSLPFPLLSDPEKTMIDAYGAWGEKKFLGKTYDGILRISYLIDPQGKIAKVYGTVKAEEHPEEVLRDVKEHATLSAQ